MSTSERRAWFLVGMLLAISAGLSLVLWSIVR